MGRYLRRMVAIPFFGLHQRSAFILCCGRDEEVYVVGQSANGQNAHQYTAERLSW